MYWGVVVRTLYIDGIGGVKLLGVIDVNSISVARGIQSYMDLENPIDLVLDLRSLTLRGITSLLKFMEEYRGNLTCIVRDPVPPAVLSRFSNIIKNPIIDKSVTMIDLKCYTLGFKSRERLKEFLSMEVS